MPREELLNSPEFWILEMQMILYRVLNEYLEKNMLNPKELADKISVSKGTITQILNTNADLRISKLIEISLAVGMVPRLCFYSMEEILKADESGKLYDKNDEMNSISWVNTETQSRK
jgi:transcriptional regulator with XRE-family HTH domain